MGEKKRKNRPPPSKKYSRRRAIAKRRQENQNFKEDLKLAKDNSLHPKNPSYVWNQDFYDLLECPSGCDSRDNIINVLNNKVILGDVMENVYENVSMPVVENDSINVIDIAEVHENDQVLADVISFEEMDVTDIRKEKSLQQLKDVSSNINENIETVTVNSTVHQNSSTDPSCIVYEELKLRNEENRKLKLEKKKLLKNLKEKYQKVTKNRSNQKKLRKVINAKRIRSEHVGSSHSKTDSSQPKIDSIPPVLEGRRIVDFDYMFKEMQLKLHSHDESDKNVSSLQYWTLDREVKHCGGLRSKFCFKCSKCNEECYIWSEDETKQKMNVNLASILGILAEGLGYEQARGMLAVMGIPYITDITFKSGQVKLLEDIERIALAKMEEANAEEAKLAKTAGDVDENGIPFITVVVDGSWLKRSYGTNYNSLSGCGAIIGERTGKVLYVGIKNKFCLTCCMAEKSLKAPKEHRCAKNFPASDPSTLMESRALVDGFKISLGRHGLVYKFVVGDGDSSLFKLLLQENPYKHLNIIPTKIECTNHLMRNLCKKIREITSETGARDKGCISLRDTVRKSSLLIREAVLNEVDRVVARSGETMENKIKILRDRIRFMPHHIFGDHKKCNQYEIQCDPNVEEKNLIKDLEKFGLLHKIQQHLHPFEPSFRKFAA